MSEAVKLVASEASLRLALAQVTPVVKVEVSQVALTTDVRTPDIKLTVKAEAV